MHSPSNDKWYGLIATLDTDAEESWISARIVERLGLEVTKEETLKYATFNGQPMASGKTSTVTWSSKGDGLSHETVFHVVPGYAPFDVLFGRNLLSCDEMVFGCDRKDQYTGFTQILAQNEPGVCFVFAM